MATAKKAAVTKAKLSGSIKIGVKRGVNAKAIHSMLDEIFKQHGCLTCGLGGIDIHIRPGDLILPELNKEGLNVMVY